jgi:cyanate permease
MSCDTDTFHTSDIMWHSVNLSFMTLFCWLTWVKQAIIREEGKNAYTKTDANLKVVQIEKTWQIFLYFCYIFFKNRL